MENKRHDARKSFTIDGRIYATGGSSICDCHFRDVSEHGAHVEVENPEGIPDEIILALSRDGIVRRRGRVVWRVDNELGVSFIQRNVSK